MYQAATAVAEFTFCIMAFVLPVAALSVMTLASIMMIRGFTTLVRGK